MMVDEMKRR